MTCQKNFLEKKNKYIKGQKYEVLQMVGYKEIKLFRIYHNNGTSFATDENHKDKFFK
jgi:hypothetical protein